MDKDIKNVDPVTRKLGLALTRITNYRLEITSKDKLKMEKIVERQKRKAIATKRQRTRQRISLSSEDLMTAVT